MMKHGQQQQRGRLSLQQLWFFVQPSMRSLEVLAVVAKRTNADLCTGGALLNAVHSLARYGCFSFQDPIERC